MEGFGKDFPKIKTSYVRAQTGALYNKILSERSAGRFDVDVLQLSDIAPAIDFQKTRRLRALRRRRRRDAYKPDYLSDPRGYVLLDRRDLRRHRLQQGQGEARGGAEDLEGHAAIRAGKNAISCKISTSGMQYVQWYMLRKLYGNDFWKEFAKQRPRGFDSRVQLFDRLAKGDDKICALAEYAAYMLYKEKGADIEFVAPPDGLPATPLIVGAVNKAPHPEAAKLFVDWAMSNRGQTFYQNHPNLHLRLASAPTRRRWRPAEASARLQAALPDRLGRTTASQRDRSPRSGTRCWASERAMAPSG